MENIERLLGELALNNFEAESMHWVDVVYVVNPLDFYVRPVRYNKLVATFRKMTPTYKFSDIKIKDMVIYNLYYQVNGRYFIRGRVSRIQSVNDQVECDIFAIDYGFTDKSVPLEQLWQCSPDLLNTPALAYHSQLANCFPVGSAYWTEYATKIFRSHLGHGRVKMTVLGRTSSKLVIKLMNTNLNDVATLLAVAGVSDVGSYYDCIPWKPLIVRKRFNFEFKKLNVNEKLHVTVLGGKSLKKFYVKEVKDYNQFWTHADNITFYARREYSLIPNHLIEGAIICVKDKEKNQYHRAVIKKVTKLNSTAVLQLVDWGRDEEFAVERMKYMSKQSLKTPMTTIYCSAAENQAWDNEFKNYLTPGFEFYITVKRLGYEFECPYTVDISPIEDEKCEGAIAMKLEKLKEETKIEPIENFFPWTNSCGRDIVKKRHLGCGDFEFLNTPDISPTQSDEEDNCQEPVTWDKLVTKRRVPYKGIGYKFIVPKPIDRSYRSKQPERNCVGANALVIESSEKNEEYEFEFSNIGDPSVITEISEKKCEETTVPLIINENLKPTENNLIPFSSDTVSSTLKNKGKEKEYEGTILQSVTEISENKCEKATVPLTENENLNSVENINTAPLYTDDNSLETENKETKHESIIIQIIEESQYIETIEVQLTCTNKEKVQFETKEEQQSLHDDLKKYE